MEIDRLLFLMLGIIARATLLPGSGYISTWEIGYVLETLGYQDVSIACRIPATPFDAVLEKLKQDELIEEVPDLGLRYRLARRAE